MSPKGPGRWSGQVAPPDDEQTFYLLVTREPGGSQGAVLRNTERDYGAIFGLRALVRSGSQVSLLGRRGAQTSDSVMITGSFDSVRQVITINFPYRGGSYDFRRDEDPRSGFYPRGRAPTRYVYRVPPALDDGWATASVDDVGIDRARNPYGGGGMGLFARDFIKFGQLMLDDGTWHGRRILSPGFVAGATSLHTRLGPSEREYGMLWWPEAKPYNNRTVRSFAALGAGGQIVMVFPELDLVVATTGGSYISRGWRYVGGELIPKHILPAVRPVQ